MPWLRLLRKSPPPSSEKISGPFTERVIRAFYLEASGLVRVSTTAALMISGVKTLQLRYPFFYILFSCSLAEKSIFRIAYP